jgi:uncharacterized OB-fold protein
MLEQKYEKPLPIITRQTKPFWDGCKRHELMVQRCTKCGWHNLPGADLCPKCSGGLEWVRASGKGKVHTFTIMHMLYNQAFKNDLPYNVSIIELEEGPLLLSNIIDIDNDKISIGMPVEVVFKDVTTEEAIHQFRVA